MKSEIDLLYLNKIKPHLNKVKQWIKEEKENSFIAQQLKIGMTSLYRKRREYPEFENLFQDRIKYKRYNPTNKYKDLVYLNKIKPYFEDIKKWVKEGKNQKTIGDLLGVGNATFFTKKAKYPEFADLLKDLSSNHYGEKKKVINTESDAEVIINDETVKLTEHVSEVIINGEKVRIKEGDTAAEIDKKIVFKQQSIGSNSLVQPLQDTKDKEAKIIINGIKDSDNTEKNDTDAAVFSSLASDQIFPSIAVKISDKNNSSEELIPVLAFVNMLVRRLIQQIRHPENDLPDILDQTADMLNKCVTTKDCECRKEQKRLEKKVEELTSLIQKLNEELDEFRAIDNIAHIYIEDLNAAQKKKKRK